MALTTFVDGRYFGTRFGVGRPWILALHGWQRTHRDFAAVLDGLDAVAIDLPGFGVAPPPSDGWSTAEYAAWLGPLLDELTFPAVVLGHSFGGRVATRLAAAHPDRIGALVLTGVPLTRDPSLPPARSPLVFRVGRQLYRWHFISQRRMDSYRERYGSADYRAAQGVIRDVLVKAVNEDYLDDLSSFGGPVELVWGDRDAEVGAAVADAALGVCANGRLTVVKEAGHLLPKQRPDVLRQALLNHRPAPEPE